MKAAAALLCLLAFGAGRLSKAQPFTVEPMEFETRLLEPLQRQEDNYTGFVFDFDTAKVSVGLPTCRPLRRRLRGAYVCRLPRLPRQIRSAMENVVTVVIVVLESITFEICKILQTYSELIGSTSKTIKAF